METNPKVHSRDTFQTLKHKSDISFFFFLKKEFGLVNEASSFTTQKGRSQKNSSTSCREVERCPYIITIFYWFSSFYFFCLR